MGAIRAIKLDCSRDTYIGYCVISDSMDFCGTHGSVQTSINQCEDLTVVTKSLSRRLKCSRR